MSIEARVDAAIRELLAQRAPDASICPSEVARAVAPSAWRGLMPVVRDVARVLAQKGELELRKRNRVIDPVSEIRGPIWIAWAGHAGKPG